MEMSSAQSVSLDQVLRRRHLLSQSRHAMVWAVINAMFAILLTADLKYSFIGNNFDSNLLKNLICILDIIIAIILVLNVFYDFGLWFWRKHLMIEIELTSNQMTAFGVKDNEIGFKQCKPIADHSQTASPLAPLATTPAFEMSFVSDLDRHSSLNSTLLSNANTSLSDGLSCHQIDTSVNTTSTSWEYERQLSPLATTSPLIGDESGNRSQTGFVRLRRSVQSHKPSNESIVTNERQLEDYLRDFERKEQRFEEIVESEKRRQTNNSSTAWNSSLLNNSLSPIADDNNQSTYQFAIDSPLRLNNVEFDSVNSSVTSSKAIDLLITKLKIDETVMNQWIENIRKWISLTILCRLVEQIDKINDSLVKSGHFDALIGEASLQTLKQIVSLKKPQFSNLENVLPFLELTSNQQYLVQRIRDLSKGGCIGQFKWNSGGSYNLKAWTQDLVTDSALVMHLFCTYMDLRLLSSPNSPEGKAFTNSYFKSFTGQVPKSQIYIFEAKPNPPHYQVFAKEDDIWELPIGRNNMFDAILVFLHCIKCQQLGHLGRINLGSSGINILWVIQQ